MARLNEKGKPLPELYPGPGPANYALPSLVGKDKADPRKQTLPAWQLGPKEVKPTVPRQKPITMIPGPQYMTADLTRYGVQRPAKDTMISLHGRFSTNKIKTKKPVDKEEPGPASYSVEKAPIMKGTNAPKWDMGRVLHYANEVIPTESMYIPNINAIKPGIPSYLIKNKSIPAKPFKPKIPSPGPAAYGPADLNMIKIRAPRFDMGKISEKNEKNEKNEKMKKEEVKGRFYDIREAKNLKRAKAYSFGMRHSEYTRPYIVPCDNM